MKTLRIAILVLAVATLALAHGGFKHIKGTVQKVNDKTIVIKTDDGTVTIPFNSSTKWENDKVAGGPKDVRPGARVIVDLAEGGEYIAVKIRYDTTQEQKHPHKKNKEKPTASSTSH